MSLNGWNIDTAAMQAILSEVVIETETLTFEQGSLRAAMEAAAESVNSALIAGALAEIHDQYLAPLVASAAQRAGRVKDQASLAVQAYIDGDQSMADTADRHASMSAPSVAPKPQMEPEE